MLVEPAEALTDLVLGLVVVALALATRRRYWRATFTWAGAAALGGFVHHGLLKRWPDVADVSWAVISVLIVVGVSYLLAATVQEVLGPGHARAFWVLRSAGLLAYVGLAATGHAGVTALLACESLTFACVIGLWGLALHRRHPLAVPVLVALVATGAAAATRALSPAVTGHVHLDPTSVYHLAQIVGMALLFRAVRHPGVLNPSHAGRTTAGAPESRP